MKKTMWYKKYLAFIIFYFVLLQLSAQTTVYLENFSAGANGWTTSTSGPNGSEWRFTTANPEATASSGATGDYAYSRRHSGSYLTDEYITNTSPVISTAGYNTLTLSLSIWYKSESSYDGMNIEYSLNGGTSWSILGAVGSGTNWYNTTKQASSGFATNTAMWSGNVGSWINASIDLSTNAPGIDDNANVKFRVNFASDYSIQYTGVAFDTFTVTGTAIPPPVAYCVSNGSTATNFGVSQVIFNTINNSDPINNVNGGYKDFTSISTNVLQAVPYDLSVYVDNAKNGSQVYTKVWIDWNQDGVFNTTNEEYDLGRRAVFGASIGITPLSPLSITIPATAKIGSTRMRVSAKSTAYSTACETGFDGEVEDYSINVLPPPPAGPGGVTSGLKLWLRADKGLSYTDGQGVALWPDQGLAVADATVNTTGQEPTFRDNTLRNINFNPVIEFSNTPGSPYSTNYNLLPQQYLESSNGFYTQDMYIVAFPNGTITSTTLNMDTFSGDADPNNSADTDLTGIGYGIYSSRFSPPGNEILSYTISSANANGYGRAYTSSTASFTNVGIVNATNNTSSPTSELLYYNGNDIGNTEVNVSSFSNVTNSRYWIGRSQAYTASFDGRLPEIINFSTKLSAIDRNKVQSYLSIKYGITLLDASGATDNYTSANDIKIWDATANAGFNSDVAGIGRDDAGAFSQKQSKSVNTSAIISIGLGNIATTNNLNTNTFTDDGDFLVWGSNGSELTTFDPAQTINLSTLTTTFTAVSRKWKIVETATTDIPEVLLSVPTTSLTVLAAGKEYTLVVSDNAAFGANDIIDVIPFTTNGANSEVSYDFDGTKYFTIAAATQNVTKKRVDLGIGQFLLGDKTLELSNSFTVSAWLRNDGLGGTFISKGTAYNFKIDGAGKIQVDWNGSTQFTSNSSIQVGKWHHITLTYSANTANLYLDGVLDKSVSSLTNPAADNTQRFTIGALYTNKTTVSSFDGAIDEVRIWSAPLSITEIRFIMNQEIQIFGANTTGVIIPSGITKDDISTRAWSNLKAYYDMNSYYGTSVEDRSSNKNWLYINYLTKDKKIVEPQTAPLPYVSVLNGNWDDAATWSTNLTQYPPDSTLYSTPVDWNIVETQNKIYTNNRDVKLLGLISTLDTLTVNDPQELNISHYLKLDGVIDLQGESQLVQTDGSDLDVNSGGNLNRDQQGTSNSYKYNYWSSPVGNVSTTANNTPHSIADVLRDGTSAAWPLTINFQPLFDAADEAATSPIILSTYWMNTFVNKLGGDYNSWTQVFETGALLAGQGFLMKGSNATTANQNYTFIGKPNNGDISLTLGANNNYLVGNPYPSAIDANAFIDDNLSVADGGNSTSPSTIDGTLYFWDHFGTATSHNLSSYQGGYGTYTKVGGIAATSPIATPSTSSNIPERYIPVAQGFIVDASPSGGTIAFKNSQRIFKTEASGTSIFLKTNGAAKSKTVNTATPSIRLLFDSPDNWRSELLLGFNPNATDQIDPGYDGALFGNYPEDMYWVINSNKYVIQGVKDFNTDRILPLGIKVSKAGTAIIKLKNIENLPANTKVYIKDNLTGNATNINNSDYTTHLEPGVYENRFSLVFKSSGTLSVNDETLNKNIITYYNKGSKSIEIDNGTANKITKIILFNYIGQTVKVWQDNLTVKHLSLPVSKLNGIYIIKIDTNNGPLNNKIVIE